MTQYDAVVVGSGPNGLAAAITLAKEGKSVLVLEAKDTIGGGMRSAELTLPGFTHDICSAIHPLGIGSPFFEKLPLDQHGLKWIQPEAPLAHPFTDGSALFLERSLEETAEFLSEDRAAYKNLLTPLVKDWPCLASDILAPLHIPRHPLKMARFGFYALQSAERIAYTYFKTPKTRALFAGLAAHSIMPFNKYLTGGFGLMLAVLGHSVGWPMPQGGTQKLADALAAYFLSLGGKIETNAFIEQFDQIPSARVILFDLCPKQLLSIAGERLPLRYRNELTKYRYGPGVFKIDWALNAPIPWKNKECMRAGTVHLGGSFEEIAASERKVWEGKLPQNHFIILAQPTLFDPTRAPQGKHTAWAYCHVPNGSPCDRTKEIEAQIEQVAPGFKECILARSIKSAVNMEDYNPNYVGGDISGGVADLSQFFTRPAKRLVPYSTPDKTLYICSASTPPGGGVHGMCGYHAAKAVLKFQGKC